MGHAKPEIILYLNMQSKGLAVFLIINTKQKAQTFAVVYNVGVTLMSTGSSKPRKVLSAAATPDDDELPDEIWNLLL